MSKVLTERQIRQLIRKAIILSEGTPPPPNSLVPSSVPAATAAAALNLPNPTDYYEILRTPYTLSFPKPDDSSSGGIERLQIEAVMRPEGKGGKEYGIIYDGELKRFYNSFNFQERLKKAHDAANGNLKNEIVLSLAIVLEVLSDFKKAKSGPDFGFTASPGGLTALPGNGLNTRLQGQLSSAPFDELVVAGYGPIDNVTMDIDIPYLEFYTQSATGLQATMQNAALAAAVQGNGVQAGLYQGAAWAAGNIPIPWARGATWNVGDWVGENLNTSGGGGTPPAWQLDGFVNPGKAFYNLGSNGLDKFLTNQMATNNATGMIKEGPVTNNKVISAVMANLKEGITDASTGRAAMTTLEFWKVIAVYYYIATGGAELVEGIKEYLRDVYDAFESRTGGFDDIAERLTDTLSGASEETSGRRYGRGER